MTLPAAGVQLLANGSADFEAALKSAGKALDTMGQAAQGMAGKLSVFDSVLAPVTRLVDQFASRFLRMLEMQMIRNIERFIGATVSGTAFAETMQAMGVQLEGIAKYDLSPFWSKFNELVTKASPGIQAFVDYAAKSFNDLGVAALTWGENISGQLAQGIINGANAVLDALINIGNLIASYLMPGSPPKLLPELDKWGTEAANVFIQGWSNADFGLFNEMAGEIEKAIRSSAGTKDTNLIPTILGTREAIAQAVEQARETGNVTSASLDQVYKAAGATTVGMQAYLKSAFDLTLADKNLKAAQDELNAVTAKYDSLIKPIDNQLQALNDSQQQLADQQKEYALNLILNDPNATASEKASARMELEKIGLEERKQGLEEEKAKAVDAASVKVEAAKAAQVAAQDQYDQAKAVIDLQADQNKLYTEQIKLLDQLAKAINKLAEARKTPAGGKGAGGVAPIKSPFDLANFIPDSIKQKLAELEATFARVWGAIANVMQPAVDAWNGTVLPAWNGLVQAFVTSLPRIEQYIADMVAFAIADLGIVLPTLFTNLAASLNALTLIWQNHGDTIMSIINALWRFVVAVTLGSFTLLSGIVAAGLTLLAGDFDGWSLAFQGKWGAVWDNAWQTVAKTGVIITNTLNTFLALALSIVGMKLADFIAIWQGNWDNALFILNAGLTSMGELMIIMLAVFYDTFYNWGAAFAKFWNEHWGQIEMIYNDFSKWLKEATDPIVKVIDGIGNAVNTLIGIFNNLADVIRHLPTPPKWWVGHSPSPAEKGFWGIADSLQAVTSNMLDMGRVVQGLPVGGLFGGQVYAPATAGQMAMGGGYSSSNVNNWNYSPSYAAPAPSPQRDFAVMKVWAR